MEKRCTNAGCSMRNIDVETDIEKCLGCGHELKLSAAEALRSAFGGASDLLDDLFGGRA